MALAKDPEDRFTLPYTGTYNSKYSSHELSQSPTWEWKSVLRCQTDSGTQGPLYVRIVV